MPKTKRISEGGTCCTLTWLRDTKEQKDRRAGKKKAATGPGTSSRSRAENEQKTKTNRKRRGRACYLIAWLSGNGLRV
jgi:hypothetical protein